MIRFLLHRPIAVLVSTLALMALGVVTFTQIPVSLLPDVAIPEITVQVAYPQASARALHTAIVKPLKNQLQQVNHLADIEAQTQDGLAVVKLKFDYGTNINLAYIETNEKIDGIIGSLPRDMERPKVIKAGAADIPVFYLNIAPRPPMGELSNSPIGGRGAFLELSEFCENVLKRRIEQLKEVALVDMTGLDKPEVMIIPNRATMQSLGLSEQQLAQILQQNNIELGNLLVKDGQYQYNIRFASVLKTTQDIENIYFKHNNRLLQLKEIAQVRIQAQKLRGLYTYKGNRAVCMAIIKQSDTQLLQLKKELNSLLAHFEQDYPNLHFEVSQDQTELLQLSINNLIGNILFGALCTFVMIFFFMNDLKTPILIGLVIPVSLVITFLFFYLFGISINIVSLAGLVLGIGEIIDSSIIVIENIEQYREENHPLDEACIQGTTEVIVPLFTSILTNSAVFVPLIFLSGIAGALFFDQALAVSISLGVSLLCSYTFIPVLYRLFYLKQERLKGFQLKPLTWLMRLSERAYDSLLDKVFRFKPLFFSLFAVLLGLSVLLFLHIEKRGMPAISQTELEVKLDWNESVTIEENNRRITQLLSSLHTPTLYTGAFVGTQQFLLNRALQQNFNESQVILKVSDYQQYKLIKQEFYTFFKRQYPQALAQFSAAKNVFEQLFNTSQAALQVHISDNRKTEVPSIEQSSKLYQAFVQAGIKTEAPALQNRIYIEVLTDRLILYDTDYDRTIQALKTLFNENNIGSLKAEQKYIPITIGGNPTRLEELLQNATVNTNKGTLIPLKELIKAGKQQDYKSFFGGKEGDYIPFDFAIASQDIHQAQATIQKVLQQQEGLTASYSGGYQRNTGFLKELGFVVIVAIALLYFILTAQFESLVQPLIVMLTILFGLTGALLFLWLGGDSLNIMSAIGMVVLVGILDNDSILKIDTMNRSKDSMALIDAIKLSGKRRLKSQLMTFLTTILGLLPVLFSDGLGSELQRPLALSVIGGMCVGLFISLSFIPLIYWLMYRQRYN